jgi:hypothetical protein
MITPLQLRTFPHPPAARTVFASEYNLVLWAPAWSKSPGDDEHKEPKTLRRTVAARPRVEPVATQHAYTGLRVCFTIEPSEGRRYGAGYRNALTLLTAPDIPT